MNIPVYYVVYGDLNALSLVESPAIQEEFQVFSTSKSVPVKFSLDEDKHIVFGPAMIPDKPIYRISKTGEPYYMVFTKDVISQMVLNNIKSGNLQLSLEHSGVPILNIYLIESFISREGLSPIGYEDVPYGTWFVSLKIEDDQVWSDIKSGKFTGFSIEALVDIDPNQEPESIDDIINNILD